MKHFLSIDDFGPDIISGIFERADHIRKDERNLFTRSRNITVASFFAEPSTRTRFSFEKAAHCLGFHLLTAADASASSSIKKGESLKDTFRTLSQYADLIVFRHQDENWPEAARKYSRVPVINAGSGSGEHPTQALLDLYTIQTEIGLIHNKNILFCGDLLYGRTVHSLIKLLARYDCKIYLCPAEAHTLSWSKPTCLNLPDKYSEIDTSTIPKVLAETALPMMDVVYMTRIQRERHQDEDGYPAEITTLKLDKKLLDTMKTTSVILHPLPRNDEIAEEVDDDPRAAYHERQVRNGLYIRIALMEYLLEL